MSQTQNSRDNQALLQSMLQRLKLQPGTTAGQNTTDEQSIVEANSDLQTLNNTPVNGFEPTGNVKRDFTTNGKTQETDISSDGRKEHGLQLQTGHLFSPKSGQDTSAVSSKGGYNFSNFETTQDTSKGLNTGESTEQDQNSGFVPKMYSWSPKSPDSQHNKTSFDGMFGATVHNTQTPSNSQNTANNTKPRSSENKTYRWTQKIKQKWKERPGSFGKKGRDVRFINKNMQENSPQFLPLTTGNSILPSTEDSQGTLTTDHNKTISQTLEGNNEYMRSRNDFDLGLGSFSLLDEIVSGQEWAKFLNPSIPASVHEGASPAMDQTLINHCVEKSSIHSMSKDVGNNSWTSGINGKAPDTDIAMNQVPTGNKGEALIPVSMDITEKSRVQSEPMDQGLSQSDMQVTVCEQQSCQPNTKTQPANTEDGSWLRGRSSLSRKRQYQSYEKLETLFQTNESDEADGSVFLPDNHVMDNTNERSMCLFSSTPTPCSPVRGVLKPTFSCDSANSMETLSKRRRMDETRHVHFSEEIITIDPPELGPYDSESEEEEEEVEEDSLIEEDSEEQLAEPVLFGPRRPEQVSPARRPVLPGWIRALKRRNTGKKPR